MKKRKINGVLSVLFMPITFVYYETLLRIFNSNFIFSEYACPCIFGASAGLLAAAVLSFAPPKANKICTALLLFIIGTAFAAECLVKKNFQTYMTPSSVLAGAGGVLREYGSNLAASIFGGLLEIILFFAPAVIYAVFGSRLCLAPGERIKPVFAVIPIVCSAALFGTGAFMAGSGDSGERYKSPVDFDASAETFGLLTAVRLNIQNSILPNEAETGFVAVNSFPAAAETQAAETTAVTEEYKADTSLAETSSETEAPAEEPEVIPELGDNIMELDFDAALTRDPSGVIAELNSYVQTLTPTNKNKYTGLFEGKNLILICAEAFSDAVINEKLTPTLYRLSHNGIYFSEYYQPSWGGSTTAGEFSFVTGLVPESGLESMLKAQDNNNYFTLGNQLQRQNYTSCAFHNGQADFYSRNITHTNLGYDNFLAFGSGLENIIRIYSDDSTMISGTIDEYLDKQPFSLYYMTVSGHFSYTADNIKVKKNLQSVVDVYGNKYKDKTNYYLCYQMDLDKALEILVQKLEESGIADDTVICLTSDHYPYGLELGETYGNTEDYVTDLYGYKHSQPWEKDRNSWILWSGCLENEYKEYACEISAPTYSLDIVPTLSNLFGLEYDSRLLVGRDVFSDADPLVIWNNRSWITDKGRYNSRTKEFTPTGNFGVGKEYVEYINNIVKNKIYFSYKTTETDYYGALFGPDEIK